VEVGKTLKSAIARVDRSHGGRVKLCGNRGEGNVVVYVLAPVFKADGRVRVVFARLLLDEGWTLKRVTAANRLGAGVAVVRGGRFTLRGELVTTEVGRVTAVVVAAYLPRPRVASEGRRSVGERVDWG
jgi:hypothetical protein